MKVVILAGGLGTRLTEETEVKPKPMVEIGGMPIIWHIMKIFSTHGFDEFIICLGYKGFIIKEYFANYFLHLSDVTIELSTGNSVWPGASNIKEGIVIVPLIERSDPSIGRIALKLINPTYLSKE